MLFNKYQYNQDSVKRRGYSQTCIAYDEQGDRFFVKWILGIEKNSTKSKILSDKLRHLQKVTHPLLPTIMDYGFDEELSTYAVVYQFIDACSLEDSVGESDFNIMLIGLSDVADCLCKLHVSGSISHGDLTPANILIDNQQNFYLIDFGLSDITNTLSQEQNLQIFAREFAAPEKFSKSKKCFPYQSDIFSFGKIIEWLFNQYYRSLQDEQSGFLRERILAENPEARPSWKEVVSFMNRLRSNTNTKYIFTTFGSKLESSQLKSDVISDLNFCKPSFDISISQRELGKLHLWIYSKKYKVEALYVEDKTPQLNLLTDRMMLSQMNNCGAGETSITLAPNGKFYVCPAFYYEDENDSIGDLEHGLNIKNKQLYRLDHAPICRHCDAWQCKRCIWLNRKTTLEVNTPSHEQCVMAHLERNASRKLLNNIRKHGTFLPEQEEIKEINYLDPFDKRDEWI